MTTPGEHPAAPDTRIDPGSFRDPGNRVFTVDGEVYRALDKRNLDAWEALTNSRFFGEQLWLILIGWVIVLVVTLVTFALMRAPWGRVVRSVREDEDAARALGKNAYGYKVQSLIIGGVMGGLGGMVLAIGTQTVQPDSYSPPITFFLYTALILGGLGRVWTPIVGSIFFWMLLSLTDNFLREAVDNRFLGINHIMDGVQVGQVRFMLVGVGLALLMVFRPQGAAFRRTAPLPRVRSPSCRSEARSGCASWLQKL